MGRFPDTVMNRIKHSGVWGIFIPGLKEGSLYKYELKTQEKEIVLKADPYAFLFRKET